MKLKEQIYNWYIDSDLAQSSDVIANEIVNVVKLWLEKQHLTEKDYKYDQSYFSGWSDCIDTLERDLR